MVELYDYQIDAVNRLRTGSILCGGVGSGKSRTAIAYYLFRVCRGSVPVNGNGDIEFMENPLDLYIITTARKRDTMEWEEECSPFLLNTNSNLNSNKTKLIVDSWNNIKKYKDVTNAFFIFDEQKVTGYGTWAKTFLKIAKHNRWIMLSATPGDTWSDYIPVFIANGYYRNKTDFADQHIMYKRYVSYPCVDRYVNTGILIKHRKDILVMMNYKKHTIDHNEYINCEFNKKLYIWCNKKNWNIYTGLPIMNSSERCQLLRKITNTDPSRLLEVGKIISNKKKAIIFYTFNYELDMLTLFLSDKGIKFSQWNSHIHETIPTGTEWAYLVQYNACEAWNCITCDTVIFYSQTYSYRSKVQAMGRIDRANTPYTDLYYYNLISNSVLDRSISLALRMKKDFNAVEWCKTQNK